MIPGNVWSPIRQGILMRFREIKSQGTTWFLWKTNLPTSSEAVSLNGQLLRNLNSNPTLYAPEGFCESLGQNGTNMADSSCPLHPSYRLRGFAQVFVDLLLRGRTWRTRVPHQKRRVNFFPWYALIRGLHETSHVDWWDARMTSQLTSLFL